MVRLKDIGLKFGAALIQGHSEILAVEPQLFRRDFSIAL
jgi:hypothetical protein